MVHVRIGTTEETMSWDAFEAKVAAGQIPADAMLRFAPVTGDTWEPAHSLDFYQSIAESRSSAFARMQAAVGPPWLTAAIVGVQVRIWWWAHLPDAGAWLTTSWTKWGPPILEAGEVWRLFTMGILHTGFTHALMNLTWLAYTGYHLERALGRRSLALVYAASVMVGSLFSLFGAPATPSLGASGGVFGLVAATVVFGFARPELLGDRTRHVYGFALLPYLVFMFASGMTSASTDNWAHFGGLLTGAALALALDPPGFERRPRWNAGVQRGVTAAMLVTTVGLWATGPRWVRLQPSWEAKLSERRGGDTLAGRRALQEADDEALLRHTVPVGWRPGHEPHLGAIWRTPRGERALRAQHLERPTAWTSDDLLATLTDRWNDAGVAYALSPPTPRTWLGLPGVVYRASLPDPVPRTLEIRLAHQGQHGIVAAWQVESTLAPRLASLAERWFDSITWRGLDTTDAARRRFASASTLAEQRKAARTLTAFGDWQTAWTAWTRDDGAPGDRFDARAELITPHASTDDAVEAVEALLAEAASIPMPPDRIVTVATLASHAGKHALARAWLDAGWWRAPGDRDLARARRDAGLSVQLTPSGVPAEVAVDLVTTIPRDAERQRTLVADVVGSGPHLDVDGMLRWRRTRQEATLAAYDAAAGADREVLLYALVFGQLPDTSTPVIAHLQARLEQVARGRMRLDAPVAARVEDTLQALQNTPE